MAEITVSVNSRPFQVVCRDGEEAQVSQLAEDLAARVAAIKKGNEKAGDSHLLVLAGLVLSNDVRDLKRELEAVRQEMVEASTISWRTASNSRFKSRTSLLSTKPASTSKWLSPAFSLPFLMAATRAAKSSASCETCASSPSRHTT